MARTSSSVRVSYPFHAAVDGELRRHAARTGIPAAEIIRRAFDLYEALLYQYNGKIPPEMVQPAVQPDGNPYPNTAKRIPFFIDPYLAYKLKPWANQEAHVLGYAVLAYIGMWAQINPQDAQNDLSYVDQLPASSALPTPNGSDPETSEIEELPDDTGTSEETGNEPTDEQIPTDEENASNEAEATDQQGVAQENQSDASEAEDEIFTEAEPSPDHLDDQGEPTQDIHGNPIGTLYDRNGDITNLDKDGNLINWDEFGYPEGTTYDQAGNPNNLDEDGFPILNSQAAA